MKKNTSGFSLAETMLTLLLAAILFSSVFYVISISNRSSAGSYHLFLAEQLTREPVEILRSMKLECLLSLDPNGTFADYRLNQWQKISPESISTGIRRSPDSAVFERKITIEQIHDKNQQNAILARVLVRPAPEYVNKIVLPKKEIVSTCIILQ